MELSLYYRDGSGWSDPEILYDLMLKLNSDNETKVEDQRTGVVRNKGVMENFANTPFIRRFMHYGDGLGSNGSHLFKLITLYLVLTIYDIALALNYKPIGVNNLFQEWKNDTFKQGFEINVGRLK